MHASTDDMTSALANVRVALSIDEWATDRGLDRSRGHICVRRLTSEGCRKPRGKCFGGMPLPLADEFSLWTQLDFPRPAEPVVIILEYRQRADLAPAERIASEYGLEFRSQLWQSQRRVTTVAFLFARQHERLLFGVRS